MYGTQFKMTCTIASLKLESTGMWLALAFESLGFKFILAPAKSKQNEKLAAICSRNWNHAT